MAAVVWKGFVSFGLVSFPVRLMVAARNKPMRFHMLHKKDLSRVKEVWYCAQEDKPIERADIVKGYEAGKGEYVVVEDKELKEIAPPTATTMDIVQFVRETEVDPIYFERSYYVAPGENVEKFAIMPEITPILTFDPSRFDEHGGFWSTNVTCTNITVGNPTNLVPSVTASVNRWMTLTNNGVRYFVPLYQ